MHQGGKRADIVGNLNGQLFVIELKKSLSLDVIAQACHWKRYAHRVSVAVPIRVGKRFNQRIALHHDQTRKFAGAVLAWQGIGLLELEDRYEIQIHERVAPFARFKVIAGLEACLVPEHRDFAVAGNSEAKRWTKFRSTCEKLRQYVNEHPTCSLKEALAAIPHHYASLASARGALVPLLLKGVVEGVVYDAETGVLSVITDGDVDFC